MGKIRHIAYRCSDIAKYEEFFVNGLGLEVVLRRGNGAVDLSDGSINITLLPPNLTPADGEAGIGIAHLGFTVEDDEAVAASLKAAGASELNQVRMDEAHYEIKFQGPDGIVVDLGHWAGTAPIAEASSLHGATEARVAMAVPSGEVDE
jgi:catechol 2,3-dioxygenase-like lactoylglutathione lyase family enzyme